MAEGYGYLQPSDTKGGYNPVAFIVQQLLGRVRTLVVARVVAVNGSTVDVQPLVSMVDSQGNATNHGTIYGIPYLQMQAGTAAVVAVPVVGDVGLIGVCDRDSSAATSSRKVGPPPSGREFDLSDAVYIMGIAGGAAPTTTITVGPSGIAIASASAITITPGGGNPVVVNGDLHATGAIIAGFGGVDQVGLQTHEHSANNTPPTPGT
jgi:hypothetical protein